ncbi:uncharacterized protein LOC121385986 [Gigantopelta aegis]|uniref:uncharacterized protein LOC121385986 n=1 Tax=Gigantopelta aegis TaxID=1735272 RepID=UPI001B8874DB|nr:uncharacterized protein LOC121385986 [Gigantopelta aegis]
MAVSRRLLLICVVCCSLHCSAEFPEQVLHLSKPDSYPHYGQPYSLECNVTSYARYQSITFKRNTEEICQIYIDVINNKTVCLNNQNDTADYQCSCVGFYDNERIYNVRITSVKLVDATKWTCVSVHYFQHSNAIFLNYGPDSATITGNQLQFPADGANTLRLNCTTSVTNSHVIFTWISINSTSKARTLTTTGALVSHSTSAGFTYSQELMIALRWYQDADNIICSVRNKNVSSFIPVTSSVNLDLLYGPEKVTITGSQPHFIADGVNTLTLICKTSITKGLVAFEWINATSTEQITTNVGSIETQNVGRGFTFSQSMQITPAWYQDEDVIKCEVTNTNISGSNPLTNSVTLDLIYLPLKHNFGIS